MSYETKPRKRLRLKVDSAIDNRLERIEWGIARAGGGTSDPCICADGSRAKLYKIVDAQTDARGEPMDSPAIPEPGPCQASIHKGDPGYLFPKMDPRPGQDRLVELAIEQGYEHEPEIDYSPSWNLERGNVAEVSWHERTEYPNRTRGEKSPDPSTYLNQVDELEPGELAAMVHPPVDEDPIQRALRDRVARLRPTSIEETDEDYYSEKWLDVGAGN